MTENSADPVPDATPTVSQAVHLPDQQPVTPATVVVAEKTSHTRTILEIVGGVVAVGLIFVSGAAGFVLGHVTAKHDGRGDGDRMMLRIDRDGDGGPTLERGQGQWDSRGGPRLQQGRPDFQGGQGLEDGQGPQGFQDGPGFPTGPDGMPAFPGAPGQDSAPALPQEGTAPTAPQGPSAAPQG